MNRLHKNYGNWAWWRQSVENGVHRLSFDRVRTVGYMLVAVVILGLLLWHFWGATEEILARQKFLSSTFVLAACSGWLAIFLGFIVFIGIRESRRGDYLRYEPAKNHLMLPRLGFTTTDALRHVSFSHERYSGRQSDVAEVVELNAVIDGERRPFLQSTSPRGQIERVTRWIAELGFTVTRHDATKSTS